MHKSRKAMIWIHVDNGIIAAADEGLLLQLRKELGKSFKLKWEENVNSIVGINILEMGGGYKLSQQQLIKLIVESSWDGTPSTKLPLPAK
ncbi:hypothetical protein O181_129043 [Austropuccinia psidii MF-1]|uniref:Reverse transcriptase Ty1/copia-type domain-containing protein n=1 Tax=Austropuccinia psidii MF-1 TaxID=1389203 RepID=A0A9Q3KXF8_9BASI|nr:hypothetical protein [Austropuccinia psidii MF-1]